MRDRLRHRERERQTDRQRERETDTERGRNRETQRERVVLCEKEGETGAKWKRSVLWRGRGTAGHETGEIDAVGDETVDPERPRGDGCGRIGRTVPQIRSGKGRCPVRHPRAHARDQLNPTTTEKPQPFPCVKFNPPDLT